jgi:hypothetical protein
VSRPIPTNIEHECYYLCEKKSLYYEVHQKSKLKVKSSKMNYFGGFHSTEVRNKNSKKLLDF